MSSTNDAQEPHLAGIALLRSESMELLREAFSDDEIVEQSWFLLQGAVRMFQARAVLKEEEASMLLALPTDLYEDRWANTFIHFSVLNVIEGGGEPIPYEEPQRENVVRMHMTQVQGIVDQIAELDGSSPELVIDHLHRFMLMNFADQIL